LGILEKIKSLYPGVNQQFLKFDLKKVTLTFDQEHFDTEVKVALGSGDNADFCILKKYSSELKIFMVLLNDLFQKPKI
jgi:hypothetical protein